MNKMKSKVIALLIVIPILLILTTSSVVKLTEIVVDIPVSSVEILGEKNLSIDIAEEDNSYQIETLITPKNATNTRLKYSTEAVEGKDAATVTVSNDGLVKPLSAGTVRIIVTADGGRTASVQISYYSTKVYSVAEALTSASVHIGESVLLNADEYIAVLPKGVDYTAEWTSKNPNVATVDKRTGETTGVFSGSTVIEGSIFGIAVDENTAAVSEKTYKVQISVAVTAATIGETGIVFEGSGTSTMTKPTRGSTSFRFSCTEDKISEYGGLYLEYDETHLRGVELIDGGDGTYTVNASVKTTAPENGKYTIDILAVNGGHVTTIYVVKAILSTARISLDKTTWAIGGQKVFGVRTDSSSESAYKVAYVSDNPDVVTVDKVVLNECYAIPKAVGTANLHAVISDARNNETVLVTESVRITVVDPFETLSFTLLNDKHGLQNEVVFGGYGYANNSVFEETADISWSAKRKSGITLAEQVATNELNWFSSDENIATFDNGTLSIVGNGVVTLTAESVYNAALGTDIKTQITVRCIKNGINVKSYDALNFATASNREVVLQSNVMLAPVLSDGNFTGYKDYLERVCTKVMDTTADRTYYEDNDAISAAKVRYCVEFTADVYGNGYYIDANYITRSSDLYGFSVFKGPLNLVQLKYGNISEQNASVKAQDNIVFLVRKDGISLNNVELKGCSDSAMQMEGQSGYDLTKLNNVGTVLEVVGDDCSLSYSRVNNGRTVVRIFGRQYQPDLAMASNSAAYKISAGINNCILSYGREFILKLGSNQVKKNPSVVAPTYVTAVPNSTTDAALYDDASPLFTNASGGVYTPTGAKDAYFDDNYVMTDVTMEDCVFFGAGLFCVGFESRFGGLCLHGWDYSDNYKFGTELGWGRVAGTSYAAALRLLGDVRFYDWKKIADVNSDTLIEGDAQILDIVGLNLDIAELMTLYSGEGADKLTVVSEGERYVNGAIAFYGGGKNYSFVDTSGTDASFNALSSYRVPLSSLGSRVNLIYYSAGREDFRFLLYDADSTLSKSKQEADKNDLTMYNWLAN